MTAAIPMLGALALGAQRLLPLLQQSYNGWSNFLGNRQNVIEVVDLLSLEDRTPAPPLFEKITFRESIAFDHVGFAYPRPLNERARMARYSPHINDWERNFLNDMIDRRGLSVSREPARCG